MNRATAMNEKRFFIVLSENGDKCRVNHWNNAYTQVLCTKDDGDPDEALKSLKYAMWIFYDESDQSVEPEDGGTYYIKNYGNDHYANFYHDNLMPVMEMQKHTLFKVATARDGFRLYFKNVQDTWTVKPASPGPVVMASPYEGSNNQMFDFLPAN